MATVLYVSSPGGVFLDVLALDHMWGRPAHWVAVAAPDTLSTLSGQRVQWTNEVTASGIWRMPADIRAAMRTLGEIEPDWVVSAGTAVALPWFVAARIKGVRSLWVETLNMHGEQGRVAAVCSRLAAQVVVQRSDRLSYHRRATLVGELY